jgi:hypothetical protein
MDWAQMIIDISLIIAFFAAGYMVGELQAK